MDAVNSLSAGAHANLQYANVGNDGDVFKHAALLSLASLFQRAPYPSRINYLDTHAFVPRAPLAASDWSIRVARLSAQHPAYERYARVQSAAVAEGEYLCSVGLMCKELPTACFHLSESHGATRSSLKAALRTMRPAPVVLDHAGDWAGSGRDLTPAALLALIDPFRMDAQEWQWGWQAVGRLHRPGRSAAVLCFHCDRQGPFHWPMGHVLGGAPPLRFDRGRFHLAAYFSDRLQADAVGALTPLGWTQA